MQLFDVTSLLTPQIKLIDDDPLFVPTKNHARDAGYDVRARVVNGMIGTEGVLTLYRDYLELVQTLGERVARDQFRLPNLWIDGQPVISTPGEIESGLQQLKVFFNSRPALVLAPQSLGRRVAYNIPYKAQVPLGFAIAIPKLPPPYVGVAHIYPRSGLGAKHDIVVANNVGIIDEPFRGELQASLVNRGDDIHVFGRGARVAQMTIASVLDYGKDLGQYVVRELDQTSRGERGFNSSGIH